MLPLLLALAAAPRSASAQGMGGMGMGGGGMGGGGGRRGGGGKRGGDDSSTPRGPNSSDVAKQYEDLAPLDKALNDVPDLNRQQKDSLKAIEGSYTSIFKSYAIAARNKVDSAHNAGGMPNRDEMHALRLEADSLRTRELVAARAVLSTDEQRTPFDKNVTDIRAAETKREDDMEKKRAAGGMGRGGMGGGGGMGGMGGMGGGMGGGSQPPQ